MRFYLKWLESWGIKSLQAVSVHDGYYRSSIASHTFRTHDADHSTFTGIQFCSQLLFLLLIVLLQLSFQWSTVHTAQYSQAINTVWVTICFSASWRLMERVAPQRKLAEGQRLWSAGFQQVGRTVRMIYSKYGRTLGLYYPAVIFAESSTNAFTSISVIFLSDHIGMGSMGVGIFFMCALLAIIPGAFIGGFFTRRLNPKNSWRLALTLLVTSTVIGCFSLDRNSNTIAVYSWYVFSGNPLRDVNLTLVFLQGILHWNVAWLALPRGNPHLYPLSSTGARCRVHRILRLLYTNLGVASAPNFLWLGTEGYKPIVWCIRRGHVRTGGCHNYLTLSTLGEDEGSLRA